MGRDRVCAAAGEPRADARLGASARQKGRGPGRSKQRRMAEAPERHTPFASLEATSRERLLAETAEAWYHFGDSRTSAT